MNKYRVAITETYRKIVTVEARNAREAHVRTRDAYNNTEIILTPNDFEDAQFFVLEDNEYTDAKTTPIDRKE